MSCADNGTDRAVVVSPHFDDAALSVAGWIARQSREVTIVTVNGGPPPEQATVAEWETRCGFLDPLVAFTVRETEDQRSCAAMGARRVALRYPDNPHSNIADFPVLIDLLDRLPPGVDVLIPVGIEQPSHRRVRDVALTVLTGTGRRVLAYADLPYAAALPSWGSSAAAAELVRHPCGAALRQLRELVRVGEPMALRLDDREWRFKHSAVLAHASQLLAIGTMAEVPLGSRMLSRDGPLATEVVWELHP
jgi:LmbE family N-acetylglucosaminyl deacetylase